MKNLKMTILIPLTLLLVGGTIGTAEAQARLRVRASITTPSMHLSIGQHHGHGYRLDYRRTLPATRRYDQYQLRKVDRRIAGRLGRYTGVPAKELLRHKRHGYTWSEIGRWLELPRRAVRAAMDAKTWKRYLRGDRIKSGCIRYGR